VPLHQIARTGGLAIRDRGTNPFTAPDALDTKVSHQAFDCAPCHGHALPSQLLPDLAGAIDPKILFPNTLDMLPEPLISLSSLASQLWITAPRGMTPVG